MKVEIIDSKDPQRMTIEELAKRPWIGSVRNSNHSDRRALICGTQALWTWVALNCSTVVHQNYNKLGLLRQYGGLYEYHVFDTAKELFAWMAE